MKASIVFVEEQIQELRAQMSQKANISDVRDQLSSNHSQQVDYKVGKGACGGANSPTFLCPAPKLIVATSNVFS